MVYQHFLNLNYYLRLSTSLMILLYSSAEANFSISEYMEFKIEFLDMITVSCTPPKIYFS